MKRNRITRNTKFAIAGMFALSVFALTLPREWTGKLINLVQILVPFQDAASFAVNAAEDSLTNTFENRGQSYSIDQTALQHRIAALTTMVIELQQENAMLLGIREANLSDNGLGITGRLIPARVVTKDILPWRSSGLIDAGTLRGVRDGAAVTSRKFSIDAGKEDGVRDGMVVLLSEIYIGEVMNAGTHTARVKLLSDVTTRKLVRVGRFVNEEFMLADREFILRGLGGGKMEIRDVDRRDVDSKLIQPGDVVLANPADGSTPAALTIGEIAAIHVDRKNPLLRLLTVESPISESQLRKIYVYDPED